MCFVSWAVGNGPMSSAALVAMGGIKDACADYFRPTLGNTSKDCCVNCLFTIVAANLWLSVQAVDTFWQFFFNRKSQSLLKQFGLVIADQTVEPEAIAMT